MSLPAVILVALEDSSLTKGIICNQRSSGSQAGPDSKQFQSRLQNVCERVFNKEQRKWRLFQRWDGENVAQALVEITPGERSTLKWGPNKTKNTTGKCKATLNSVCPGPPGPIKQAEQVHTFSVHFKKLSTALLSAPGFYTIRSTFLTSRGWINN